MESLTPVPLVRPGAAPATDSYPRPLIRDKNPHGLPIWRGREWAGKVAASQLCVDEQGEDCWSQALHLPWPRVSPPSSLLAGLRELLPQNPRRWNLGNMT